jgi:hypothetical protein
VNRGGESSVPGLYFAGVNTAVSNGPGVRFISGTHGTSAHLARSVARRARRGAGPVAPADADANATTDANGSVQPLTSAGTGPIPVA